MPADVHPELFTVGTTQKLGDGLVALFLIPFCAVGLTLGLIVVAGIAGAIATVPELPSAATLSTMGVATLTVAWLTRQRFWWTWRLRDDGVQVGPCWLGARVSYGDIEFLAAGAPGERVAFFRPRLVPLTIHAGPWRRYRLWLERSVARRCLDSLRARCPNAAAIDATVDPPTEYLPTTPGARRRGSRRLAWFWLGAAAAPAALLVVFVVATLSGDLGARFHEASNPAKLAFLLLCVPIALGLVWRAVQRALKHLSGERRR